jgi:predicted O-methyltransferase YrrM
MNQFYSFYTKNVGNLSQTGFQLFWNGEYEKCFQFYRQIISNIGSIEAVGFNDTLIYHHCSRQLGHGIVKDLNIPRPPVKNEIINLYQYEISQEKMVTKYSTKSILTQPSVLSKAILAAFIGVENGCQQVVETGTFLGASSYLFSGIFDSVDTIEADPRLHESSKTWLESKSNNVKCHLGDSGNILSQIITDRSKKQLIFLDAHYSTGITSKEYGICPLLRELDILTNSKIDSVIIVDDIRCMETLGYPSLKEILDRIPEGKSVTIQHDQLIIV